MLQLDGSYQCFEVEDYAHALWRKLKRDAPLSDCFIHAAPLAPAAHLAMQAALQPFIDNAISKTINVAEGIALEEFAGVYQSAYRLGLKGCATYRPNRVTGAILDSIDSQGGCCGLERESD